MARRMPPEITMLMRSPHYNPHNVTLTDIDHIPDDQLCSAIPQITDLLDDTVTDQEIVTSVQTVFETLGKTPPTELALGMFYEILGDIPSVFIHQITKKICQEVPNARPIPKDWTDRASGYTAKTSLLIHAIRKELRKRHPDHKHCSNIEHLLVQEAKGKLSLVQS